MEELLHAFFARYARVSLSDEPEALAAMYAPTFIVAGPQGSQAFANDERFIEWLRQVHAYNRSHGMRALVLRELRATALSPRHALAIVQWGATFDATAERLVAFQIAYLLERSDDNWTILSYVSERDQEEAMRQEGLL